MPRGPLTLPTRLALTDKTVCVTRTRRTDADRLHEIDCDPDTGRWLGWTVEQAIGNGPEGCLRHINRCARLWREGRNTLLAVRASGAPEGPLLAWVNLTVRVEAGIPRATVSYAAHPDSRERGVTGRAVALASTWALTELGVVRLELRADVANAASQGVARAAGFEREGVARNGGAGTSGRPCDMVVYSRVPSDLPA